ncbi:TauD/TfdA family dioxygenase [Blastococcus sp. SYSU DS0541]
MSAIPTVSPDLRPAPGALPVLRVPPDEPARWGSQNRDTVRALVAEHGVLLVRGLGIRTAADVALLAGRLGSGPMTEREAFAAREADAEGAYPSTPWPANQPMCMHHELSYTSAPPGLLLFGCLTAPETGGATAVADAAAVLADLPPDLRARAERYGWVLERTYNEEIGASWADAFGTDDPAGVDAYCRSAGIEADWRPDGTLRTRQHRPAVVTHPVGGRRCWFNQMAFLSEWTLLPEVRDFLVDEYGPDGLPFTTRFGDGSPVGPDEVAAINEVYDSHTRREPWQAGDLLLVDNVRTAHGREPFTGPREVVVALTDPVRVDAAGTTEGGAR